MSGSGTARTVRRAGLGVLGLGLGAAAAAAAVTFGGRHLRRGADPDRVEDLQMPADLRVHRVPSHDGGHLHVVERGEGTPVLCAHGVMLSSRTWVRQLRDLPAAGFRVVAFDHRGHGDSVPGAEGHDVRALARDIRSVIEHLDLGAVVLVGHSMGGMAALSFVLDHAPVAATRLGALVLCSTTSRAPFGADPRLRLLLGRVSRHSPDAASLLGAADLGHLVTRVGFGRGADPAAVELTRRMIVACSRDTRLGATRALFDFDVTDRLAEIRHPTWVLAGTADLLTPPREARRLARGIGGAHLRLVPGGGHMLMLEAPEVLAGVLREAARPADGAAVA